MNNQESDFFQESFQDTAIDARTLNLLAKLHLNSTAAATLNGASHHPAATTTAASSMDSQCTKCRTAKRQSPSTTTSGGGGHSILAGFSKLPLPPISSSAVPSSPPVIRRTISDPINSPQANNFYNQAPSAVGCFLNHRLPEISAANSVDPFSASYQVVTTTTPRRPPAPPRKLMAAPRIEGSALNEKEENPAIKRRLKRNEKRRPKEMRNGYDTESADGYNLPKDEAEASQVTESGEGGACEEAVWVERNGDSLILHFKCPCGKGYQILLNGKNCYYKLTAF